MWHQPARFEKSWPQFCQIWIKKIFTKNYLAVKGLSVKQDFNPFSMGTDFRRQNLTSFLILRWQTDIPGFVLCPLYSVCYHLMVYAGGHIFHQFRQQFFLWPHFQQTFSPTFVAKMFFFYISSSPPPRYIMEHPLRALYISHWQQRGYVLPSLLSCRPNGRYWDKPLALLKC